MPNDTLNDTVATDNNTPAITASTVAAEMPSTDAPSVDTAPEPESAVNTTPTPEPTPSDAAAPSVRNRKRASAKPQTKAAKRSKRVENVAPPQADLQAAEPSLNERAEARLAAAKAVAAFYPGSSLPFKAAFDLRRKAPINFALQRDPSRRTAGLLAAILTYCAVQPDGTFVRGSGRVPGSMLGYTGDDAKRLFSAGPESGCLSNCIPDRIDYVSGATSGAGCENAILRINFDAAESNMRAFNDKQPDGTRPFSAPLRLLGLLRKKQAANASDNA